MWEAFKVGSRWYAYMGGGDVAYSDDGGLAWVAVDGSGLVNGNYRAVCHVGWN